MKTTKDCDLEIKQMTAYSTDDAAVNTVYQKLNETSKQIIKENYNCHINNCVKNH